MWYCVHLHAQLQGLRALLPFPLLFQDAADAQHSTPRRLGAIWHIPPRRPSHAVSRPESERAVDLYDEIMIDELTRSYKLGT